MLIRILFLMGMITLGFGIIRGESSIRSYFELKKSRKVLEETVHALQAQNNNIALEIDKIKSSPEYARKVLRDKYHVTDENEKIIFFPD